MDEVETNVNWRKRPRVGNVEELMALAHDRSKVGREHLVSAVGDLFDDANAVLSEGERAIMSDILRHLVKDVENSVRRKLAQRLADSVSAPHALMVELANDEIEIAAPVLNRSKVLRDVDLIEVVRHKTLEHRLAVAVRDSVTAPVSEALVQTGDPAVVETLLRNRSATIAPDTMACVVEQSQARANYQEPLLRREDLSPELAKRMYWWVSAALRAAILERYALDPDSLDDAMEGAVHDSFDEAGVVGAPRHVESLERLLKMDEVAQNALVTALRDGEIVVFQALFRKATGLSLPCVRMIMFEPGGERLAIVCRAIDLAPKVFSAIYRLLRMSSARGTRLQRGELTRIAALYLDIRPDLALTVLRKWRRDPDYLAAIEQVTGTASSP